MNDDLYRKQEHHMSSLKRKFIPNCYLLPHRSQDIWLGTLIQGDGVTDIDGMHIIQPSALARNIIGHLKGCLYKILKRVFENSVLNSSLWYYLDTGIPNFTNFCSESELESVCDCLECCRIVLASDSHIFDKMKDSEWFITVFEACRVLQQYHSINVSHYFPICESYMTTHMGLIRNDAWRLFQSQTREWIEERLTQESFNILKLWEQSSVAKITQILREILSSHIEKSNLNRTTLDWLHVTDRVTDDPLVSCKVFFNKCFPAMLSQGSILCAVDSASLFGTILLALISCTEISAHELIVPHMYHRALLVYSGFLNKRQTILRACCNQTQGKKHSAEVSKDAVRLLHSAIIHLLNYPIVLNSDTECKDSPRLSLVLLPTFFVNYATLQPCSLPVVQLHGKLCQILADYHRSAMAQQECFHVQVVHDALYSANSTRDILVIIEYLLCPIETPYRYEALASIVCTKRPRKVEIKILNEEEIKDLRVIPLFEYGRYSVPQSQPISSAVKLKPNTLSFSHVQRCTSIKLPHIPETFPTSQISQHPPPWIQVNDSGVVEPDISGSKVFPSDSDGPASDFCHVCHKYKSSDNHSNSDEHVKNLGWYRKFSSIHDTEYTTLLAKLPCTPAKQSIIDEHTKQFDEIHQNGEWIRGIDLIQTHCIPKVKKMIEHIS